MKYVGSKNRISKELAPIIQSYIDENNIKTYIEPFVGGANMIDKIKCDNKVGYDINNYLIELLNYLKTGDLIPYSISEVEYNNVKDNKDMYEDWYVGLVGFGATFGAKWFGGYARGFKSDKITLRDIPNEGLNNLRNQREKLKNITFINNSYDKLVDIRNSVIYCDPPYKGTLKYNNIINYDDFYKWCIEMAKHNIVLISEYEMPEDKFINIFTKDVNVNIDSNKIKNGNRKRVEKLFIVKEEV